MTHSIDVNALLEKKRELGSKPAIVLAYMKGIVDSEGSYDTYRLRITNTSEKLISRLSENFGGTVCKQLPSEMTRHEAFQWSLNRHDTAELMQILPMPADLRNNAVKSYIAGLVDGDGTIYTKKVNKREKLNLYPAVVFASTTQSFAQFIFDVYGSALSLQQPRLGHREKKQYWYLMVTGERARVLIIDMLPYLNVKRDKAKIILEECN